MPPIGPVLPLEYQQLERRRRWKSLISNLYIKSMYLVKECYLKALTNSSSLWFWVTRLLVLCQGLIQAKDAEKDKEHRSR